MSLCHTFRNAVGLGSLSCLIEILCGGGGVAPSPNSILWQLEIARQEYLHQRNGQRLIMAEVTVS